MLEEDTAPVAVRIEGEGEGDLDHRTV